MEPFSVIVCRNLCFIQPFEDLRRWSAEASRTFLQKYTSLPPQLAFFTTLENRHLRFASLSFATILTNLLTVALSGVFVIRETIISADIDGLQVYAPILNDSIIHLSQAFESVPSQVARNNGEPFQFLLSNVTAGTPLPPWTTKERYYLLINLTAVDIGPSKSNYRVATLGFEGSADRSVSTETPSNFAYELSLKSDATQIRFQTTQSFQKGSGVECFSPLGNADETVTFSDMNHTIT